MPILMYFVLGVGRTLLKRHLAVIMTAVRVLMSPG
jgi:hypothetical protein